MSSSKSTASPLDIVIVGAGIAGLSAAISCRRAGHNVQIYERSALNSEVGAAIHVCPNASRGLLAWGLDVVRARFVTCKIDSRAHATTLEKFREADMSYIAPKFGAPWFLAHRVDLHEELKRLAMEESGEGRPAIIHLKSEVTKFDPETGTIYLQSGEKVTGDLVIAADGVHSGGVQAIFGTPTRALPTSNYNFAYRFLIPTKDIVSDPETAHFIDGDDGRMKMFVGDGKRLVWYPCRDNEVHNFVAIFNSAEQVYHEDWQTAVDPAALLERYSDFHPSIVAVLRKAKDVKQWPLLYRAPIPSWHKGKLVLVGDAAHPMLPHQGQGGAQAIEDALALGIVLLNCNPALLEKRLQLYEEIRIKRASVITVFSNAGQDEPEKMHAEAAKFIPAEKIPKAPEEFLTHNFGYDVVRHCKQAMKLENPGWELPKSFFVTPPGEGLYA